MWWTSAWVVCILVEECITSVYAASSSTTTAPTTTAKSNTLASSVAITVSIVAICLAFICIVLIASIVGYLYQRKLKYMMDRSAHRDSYQNRAFEEAATDKPDSEPT